jgi:hypothetical protein
MYYPGREKLRERGVFKKDSSDSSKKNLQTCNKRFGEHGKRSGVPPHPAQLLFRSVLTSSVQTSHAWAKQ